MKNLHVKKISAMGISAQEVPSALDSAGITFNDVNCVDWQEAYPYAPRMQFRMAYTDNAIVLNYKVKEKSVRAVAPHDNGHVWEDSCCEFFSQPVDDGTYYNIECNCAGTLLVGFGEGRANRQLAPQVILDKVERWSSLGRTPFDERVGECEWQLALIVPLSTYFKHHIDSLDGTQVRANIYKCGDALCTPHFLSWNAIETEKPDFHRPDFFGLLQF